MLHPGAVVYQAKPLPQIIYSPFQARYEDILLSASSDDDSDGTRCAKRQKREAAGQHYFRTGEPKLISTAQLRGPFEPGMLVKQKRRKPVVRRAVAQTTHARTRNEENFDAIEQEHTPQPMLKNKIRAGSNDRANDSPSIRFPNVSLAPSSPTPRSSPLQAQEPKARPRNRPSEKRRGVVDREGHGYVGSKRAKMSADRAADTRTPSGPTGTQENTQARDSHYARYDTKGSRTSVEMSRPEKSRDHQVLEASLPGQSPFEYVRTRLRRRQEEQAREWQPSSPSRTEDTYQIHAHWSIENHDTEDKHLTEAAVGYRKPTSRQAASKPQNVVVGASVAPRTMQASGEHTIAESGNISHAKLPSDKAKSNSGYASQLSPQLLRLDVSNSHTGIESTRSENMMPRVKPSQSADADQLSGLSKKRTIAESNHADSEPGKEKDQANSTPCEASTRKETANEMMVPELTGSAPIPEAQVDQQALVPSRAITQVLETEHLLADSGLSQYVLSTQAAFHQALAELQTPKEHSATKLGPQHVSRSDRKQRRSNPASDDNIGTQDLLAQAPVFSISPDLHRETRSFKSLGESLTSAKAEMFIEPLSASLKAAVRPQGTAEGDNIDSDSYINIMCPTANTNKKSDVPKAFTASFVSGTTSKVSLMSPSPTERARKLGSTSIQKRKRKECGLPISQPQIRLSQDILGYQVTKQKKHSPLKSTFGSLKTSAEWQDAQPPQTMEDGNSGLLDDGKLDETIKDLQGFLGS